MKEKGDKLLKAYLVISLVLALFYFLEFYPLPSAIEYVVNLLFFAYFIFSIYALIKFVKGKFEKLAFVLPIIEIATAGISILLGFVNIFWSVETVFNMLKSFDIVVNLFIVVFAIFLLKKYK